MIGEIYLPDRIDSFWRIEWVYSFQFGAVDCTIHVSDITIFGSQSHNLLNLPISISVMFLFSSTLCQEDSVATVASLRKQSKTLTKFLDYITLLLIYYYLGVCLVYICMCFMCVFFLIHCSFICDTYPI